MKKIIRRVYSLFRENKSILPGGSVIGDPQLVKLGKNVTLSGNVIIYANAPVTIGDHTMVSLNTIFHTSTHDHHDHPMWKYRIDRPISIGQHVWIGVNSLILAGVKIGDYAVVGAGSVVTANVPEGAIVAGNPARIIGQRQKETYNRKPDIDDAIDSRARAEGFLERECRKKE
ncbi:MAG TPA: acyltransferase [Bacteroidia bacterium]|nr:acyltransferase [Bacteroidia bacterium]